MRYKILFFGKIKNYNLNNEINQKLKLFKNDFKIEHLSDKKINYKQNNAREKELNEIKNYFKNKNSNEIYKILLTEQGIEFTTKEFSNFLKETENTNRFKETIFIISGPYGPDPKLRKEIDFELSLSKMTFTHEQALYLLLEQLYRHYCFKKKIPYNK